MEWRGCCSKGWQDGGGEARHTRFSTQKTHKHEYAVAEKKQMGIEHEHVGKEEGYFLTF